MRCLFLFLSLLFPVAAIAANAPPDQSGALASPQKPRCGANASEALNEARRALATSDAGSERAALACLIEATSATSSTFAGPIRNVVETATVNATAVAGTINYYLNNQSVIYYTSKAAANWTVNFAFSPETTMNAALAAGQSITAALLVKQGPTPYRNSAIQIDGTVNGVTTYWLGDSAPSAGHANGVDIYQYTIVKTAPATYSVFASLAQY